VEAPATGTFWKHLARQIAMSGQALAQSGMAGFSCGQHGMSSAIAAVEARAMAEAGIGAASGANQPHDREDRQQAAEDKPELHAIQHLIRFPAD
jgi:hypothetical protein